MTLFTSARAAPCHIAASLHAAARLHQKNEARCLRATCYVLLLCKASGQHGSVYQCQGSSLPHCSLPPRCSTASTPICSAPYATTAVPLEPQACSQSPTTSSSQRLRSSYLLHKKQQEPTGLLGMRDAAEVQHLLLPVFSHPFSSFPLVEVPLKVVLPQWLQFRRV